MALRLHNTRLVDGGICCFNFIFEEFSSIGEKVYSRPFFFAGSRWRLQGGVKGGQFGVFLRWLGGGQHTDKVKCNIRFSVEVINNRDPSSSVRVGNMTEPDEFPRVAFGIGWSKLLSVEEIERPNSGFLDDNSLFLEVKCCMVHFLFEDKLVINLSSRTSYVSSSKFSVFGEEWYLVLYPRGEPKSDNSESQKQEHAAVYLHREEPGVLRFKATYSIFVRGGRETQVSHHFCNNNASTAFGIEKFARTKDLKAVSKGGLVSIGVKITSIEPYYYFGFDTQGWSPPNKLGEGCSIKDVFPLMLKPCSNDKKMLDFSLMLDPGPKFEHAELEDSAYYMKILWSINVVCVKDFNRSVTVNSWDVVGKSAFCHSQDEMTINTTLELNEVLFYSFNNHKCLSHLPCTPSTNRFSGTGRLGISIPTFLFLPLNLVCIGNGFTLTIPYLTLIHHRSRLFATLYFTASLLHLLSVLIIKLHKIRNLGGAGVSPKLAKSTISRRLRHFVIVYSEWFCQGIQTVQPLYPRSKIQRDDSTK